ncbi:hypothetical protein [Comamonas testosteroni]|uniref:hypothetical protein n=1 Tax=Comamonas testosteroni TaxID=285 RepID=UPI00391DC7C3
MNQIRFSFSLRHGHPQESIAIKKLFDIPASRRATIIRGWISSSIGKMPSHFDWSDARESIHPPAKFSLYLEPLAPEDGDIIDSISKIPPQFINDWIRERICAAQAPEFLQLQDKAQLQTPTPTLQLVSTAAATITQQIIDDVSKKQAVLSGLFG